MSETNPANPNPRGGDDPGRLTPDEEFAADVAASRWTPAYLAGWRARMGDGPRDARQPAEWLRGWDDCDREPD
jgi:hypothetical protein